MSCGIYILRFTGTDKIYIGQSSYIEGRFVRHINTLVKGTNSKKLQEAYKTYGLPTMEVLLECAENELNSNENEAIAIFNSVDNGFNTLYRAEDTPYNVGISNGMSKFSEEQVVSVMFLLLERTDLRYNEIAGLTGVSEATVRNIACGTVHSWLRNIHPTEYEKLMLLKGTRASRPNHKNAASTLGIDCPPILSPEGEVFYITNITNFAKTHGLHQSALGLVLKGKQKVHKGWKLQ